MEQYFEDLDDCYKIKEIIDKLLEIKVVILKDSICEVKKKNSIDNLTLLITNKCNLSCIHCSQNAEGIMSKKDELSYKNICEIIDQLTELDINSITVSGGEPLIRKDFSQIIQYIKKKYKGKLILMTNALLLTEDNIDELINVFDFISISIDGCDEKLTSEIRGIGVFQNVIKKIEMLHQRNYFNIELSAILPNSIQIENKFENLCLELNVKPIIRSLIYKGRAYENNAKLLKVYEEYLMKEKRDSYSEVNSLGIGSLEACDACEGTITIDAYGDLYPCNLLQEKKYRIGNVLKEKKLLREYRNSKVAFKIHELKDMNTLPCKNCEIKKLCWFCLSDLEEFISHKHLYKDYCQARKKAIYKYYFEGEKEIEYNYLDNNIV